MSDDTLSYSLGYNGYQVYEEILRKCSNRLVTSHLGELYLLLKKMFCLDMCVAALKHYSCNFCYMS